MLRVVWMVWMVRKVRRARRVRRVRTVQRVRRVRRGWDGRLLGFYQLFTLLRPLLPGDPARRLLLLVADVALEAEAHDATPF